MKKIKVNNINVDDKLYNFINDEVLPGTNIDSKYFWKEFDKVIHELSPINQNLIKKRSYIKKKIDDWHISKKASEFDEEDYFKFLKSINYIVDEKEDFKISTSNVDDEITSIPGPQLVVPVDNARYALNAANARWN